MVLIRNIFKILVRNLQKKHKINKMKKEREEEINYYLNLTTEELKKLSDIKLYIAVTTRLSYKVRTNNSDINPLNEEEKIVFETDIYDSEVNNGGLCQFFTNSSSLVAPYISNNLKILKAKEHKKLFDNFIKENKINVNDLYSFEITMIDNIKEQYQNNLDKYPFDEFDTNFYKLPPLQTILTEYIKNNISKF